MSKTYLNILMRVAGEVHAIHPARAAAVLRVLSGGPDALQDSSRGSFQGGIEAAGFEPGIDRGERIADLRGDPRGYRMHGRVAAVPLFGTLVARFDSLVPFMGCMTGYDGFVRSINHAVADPQVEAILLDVDSPGGEVGNIASAVAAVRQAKAVKPVYAIASPYAYSAAYWIASQATTLHCAPFGGVGSIGALCAHVDYSKQLVQEGVAVTLVHAGQNKVDGHPYAALPEAVRADYQAQLDYVRRAFASDVAEARGLDLEAVLATEARCFNPDQALELGLIDGIATAEELLAALQTP